MQENYPKCVTLKTTEEKKVEVITLAGEHHLARQLSTQAHTKENGTIYPGLHHRKGKALPREQPGGAFQELQGLGSPAGYCQTDLGDVSVLPALTSNGLHEPLCSFQSALTACRYLKKDTLPSFTTSSFQTPCPIDCNLPHHHHLAFHFGHSALLIDRTPP